MREIPLTKGYVAIVDDEDYDRVVQYKWCAFEVEYTVYAGRTINEKRKHEYLHRIIMGVSDPKVQVDHRDHNGLNCQKYNLRVCSSTQNQGNQKMRSDNTSGFKGVYWNTKAKKWQAQMKQLGKQIYLGSFDSKVDAAHAYDKAARKYFGEFALLNFNQ